MLSIGTVVDDLQLPLLVILTFLGALVIRMSTSKVDIEYS